MSNRITILGSGTSTGVPVIGCDCPVCTSEDPKNKRTRASIMLEHASGERLVVDTGPDFRQQMLRHQVKSLKYVFYTHVHADHCHGFDDLRAFYFHCRQPVECYVPDWNYDEFVDRFKYAFVRSGYKGTTPQVKLHRYSVGRKDDVFGDELQIGPFRLEVVHLEHGGVRTAGFRWGEFAYTTDFKEYAADLKDRWRGQLDVLVASGNNDDDAHPTHSSVSQTSTLMQDLGVRRGVISHLAHDIEYIQRSKGLPAGTELAWDGMAIDLRS